MAGAVRQPRPRHRVAARNESRQRLLFRAHLRPQRRPGRRGAAGAHRARAGQGLRVPPISCDGIEQCRAALFKASKNVLPNNFIEGMACVGGCIGGAGCHPRRKG
ncbi:MAG: [Fe-Fe] hydrogenase large subunit C-terminal domain-containing protein [Acutalibacteraceae bacterium]